MEILRRKASQRHQGMTIVLVRRDDGFFPYVTWVADPEGNFYYGHYFATRDEAIRDFAERS